MEITIENVTVTNWSGSPLLKLSDAQRSKLRLAIMYSRQITGDALELLRQYERKRIVKDAGEAQMANDYFGSQKAAKEALEKYFGLDLKQAADRAKVGGIIQKFKLTDAGLSGAFEIVVGGIHDADDVKVGVKDALSSLKRGRVKSAWRHIKFVRTGTEGWVAKGGKHTRERIHLNIDVIDEYSAGKVARVIVHEATHKFADTDDVTMVDASGDDHVGYKHDGLKHNAQGYANLDNNADSYAWGGRLMWKRKRNHRAGV